MGSRSLRFADTARLLCEDARRGGLAVPTFRSPPRVLGPDRTMRRRADGSVTVAVRLSGRPFVAVVADMIEGIVVANELSDDEAGAWRRRLWNELEGASQEAPPVDESDGDRARDAA